MTTDPHSHLPRIQSAEVLFTPADFSTLPGRDLRRATCVVFDVLRATTSMVTALANGARAIVPVAEIAEALAVRIRQPEVLLAGERDGVRIRAGQAEGIDFDFGNSPREFTSKRVRGRTIVTTTTNGTRALKACLSAQHTLVGSFLNLAATARAVEQQPPVTLLVVCSGTFEQAAYEDVLAAGALLEILSQRLTILRPSDTVHIARQVWQMGRRDPLEAVRCARNASKLLGIPELADDVPWSLRMDAFPIVAALTKEGKVEARDSRTDERKDG